MDPELAPAYLIHGDDGAKLDAALVRLKARAAGLAGDGHLEIFRPPEGARAPDPDALIGALPALSLTPGRRHLLADGVQAWPKTDADRVAESLATVPEATTVVLVARTPAKPSKTLESTIQTLSSAVTSAGGQVLAYRAPSARDLPRWLTNGASERGFRLDAAAARLIIDRMSGSDGRTPPSQTRLANELDRLALWAGDGGAVTASDIDEMVAGASAAATYALADAIVEGDVPASVSLATRLLAQGEAVTPTVYRLAPRIRDSIRASSMLAAGRSPKDVQGSLRMPPYAARMVVEKARGADPDRLRDALAAIADLEAWTRGDAEYGDELALTLAVRRAAGS